MFGKYFINIVLDRYGCFFTESEISSVSNFCLINERKTVKQIQHIYCRDILLNQIYKPYEDYLRQILSGEGMVGENSYILKK